MSSHIYSIRVCECHSNIYSIRVFECYSNINIYNIILQYIRVFYSYFPVFKCSKYSSGNFLHQKLYIKCRSHRSLLGLK